jgi:hypothetical protein
VTRDEFVNLLKENLESEAQIDFIVRGKVNDNRSVLAFLNIENVCMNVDVDDTNNFNRGGIVFSVKEEV